MTDKTERTRPMKNVLIIALLLPACGYSHRDNELIGQPKSVESTTPLVCPEQHILHLSLGVMRNGVGSMSTQDILINIPTDTLAEALKSVVASGKIINAKTNEARFRWCNEEKELVSFEILDGPAPKPTEPDGEQ
jgi:hypothetical protein